MTADTVTADAVIADQGTGENLRFGVFVPQLKSDVPTMLEQARTAEAAGFDLVLGDGSPVRPPVHHRATLESWTLLTALAGATTSLLVELHRQRRRPPRRAGAVARGVELCVVRFDDFGAHATLQRFGAEVIAPLRDRSS